MRGFLLAIVALFAAGCVSPARPSPTVESRWSLTATVTVITTLSTVDGPALAGVEARVDDRAVAVTDAAGRATFVVPAGREITIAVSHPDHQPFVPSGTATIAPGAHETWRFAFIP